MAIAAVDVSLWDLKARALGVPAIVAIAWFRAWRVLKKRGCAGHPCSALLRPETVHPVECISVQVSPEAFEIFGSTLTAFSAGVTRRSPAALLQHDGRSFA